VADALWQWPGVVNILALPALSESAASLDSVDDLPADSALLGRDIGERLVSIKSGYPRDPKVRAAVLVRAEGRCEREECGEQRPYPGFLDVHHILGVGVSDRAWTCVAICPNCHREAHFAPDQSAINERLMEYAKQFAD
jgi:5-methylcytosine-specific restriction protein A